EKQVEEPGIPRPFDCWVERPSGVIAYWIVDAGMRAQARADLMESFEQLGVRVIWVLTANLLRPDESDHETAHLTTTERALMHSSTFDGEIRNFRFVAGVSLHYLDALTETLTTFRGLELVHQPNVYRGRREDHLLSEVEIARKTGDFVHPGERERREAVQAEKKRLKQLEAENQERQTRFERRRLEDQARRATGGNMSPIVSTRSRATNFQNLINSTAKTGSDAESPLPLSERLYKCEHCGEEKPESELWGHWGTTGKCHACSKKGLW
ncbi:MAG: hypothetical protein JWL77_5277, partial [Chthonomonadaceae bacterium]|nr:hypothetical protein [Chthonomonadaceae bacterium]